MHRLAAVSLSLGYAMRLPFARLTPELLGAPKSLVLVLVLGRDAGARDGPRTSGACGRYTLTPARPGKLGHYEKAVGA